MTKRLNSTELNSILHWADEVCETSESGLPEALVMHLYPSWEGQKFLYASRPHPQGPRTAWGYRDIRRNFCDVTLLFQCEVTFS